MHRIIVVEKHGDLPRKKRENLLKFEFRDEWK